MAQQQIVGAIPMENILSCKHKAQTRRTKITVPQILKHYMQQECK